MTPELHKKIEKSARKLMVDLIGGIDYGDSRNFPEWRKKVEEVATNIITDTFLSIIDEVLEEKAQEIGKLSEGMYCSKEHLGYHNKECDGACQKYGLLLAQQIIRGTK